MSNISQWSGSAASNNAAPPNGSPEGQAPSTVNDCIREVMAAVARQFQDSDGSLVTGGTSNAYLLTTNNTNVALADQGLLIFRADRANTGAATLNVDSLGAKNIEADGAALVSGDLVADSIYAATYNATNDTYDLLNAKSGLQIGTDVQAWDAGLDDISGLAVTDGNIIVGDGANWVAESGATARTSLGVNRANLSLDTTDNPEFAGVNVGHASDTEITRDAAGQIAVAGDAVFSHEAGTYTSAKVHLSTSAPSGGSDGDVWFEHEA